MKKHHSKANFQSRRDLTCTHGHACQSGHPIRAPKSLLILGGVCTAEQLMVSKATVTTPSATNASPASQVPATTHGTAISTPTKAAPGMSRSRPLMQEIHFEFSDDARDDARDDFSGDDGLPDPVQREAHANPASTLATTTATSAAAADASVDAPASTTALTPATTTVASIGAAAASNSTGAVSKRPVRQTESVCRRIRPAAMASPAVPATDFSTKVAEKLQKAAAHTRAMRISCNVTPALKRKSSQEHGTWHACTKPHSRCWLKAGAG